MAITLFPFIRLILLKLRKRHASYRNPTTMQRHVDPHASLDEGVRRARNRCYVPRGYTWDDLNDEGVRRAYVPRGDE